jgi:S1-C subfamily serine protease
MRPAHDGGSASRSSSQESLKAPRRLWLPVAAVSVVLLAVAGFMVVYRARQDRFQQSEYEQEYKRAGENLLKILERKWSIEGEAVVESESLFESRRPKGSEELHAKTEEFTEEALRHWLHQRRSPGLRKKAEEFLSRLDPPSRALVESAAKQLDIPPTDFALDWLNCRGYGMLQALKALWREPSSFAALGKETVGTYFEGVAREPAWKEPPSLISLSPAELKLSLFGAHFFAAVDSGKPPEALREIRRIDLKSNYHILHSRGAGALDPYAVNVESRDGDWLMSCREEIQEYLSTGNRGDWCLKALGAPPPPVPAADISGAKTAPDKAEATKTIGSKGLYARLSPSVPLISTQGSMGSGFLVESKGKMYVMTNLHVVAMAGEFIEVSFLKPESGETKRTLKVKAEDCEAHPGVDLVKISLDAVVAVEDLKAMGAQPLELAAAESEPEVGVSVVAIGHPGAGRTVFPITMTEGKVSGPIREFREFGMENARYIQTTAQLNPGNSGGPLCDLEGRVVGTVTQVFGRSGDAPVIMEGLNFALVVRYIHDLLDRGGVPLPRKQKESRTTMSFFSRLQETEKELMILEYLRPDVKNSFNLTLPPGETTEKPLELRPGTRYAIWTVACGTEKMDTEEVQVDVSGKATLLPVDVASVPAGVLFLVQPKQADKYSISVTNVSKTEVRLRVQVRMH